MEPATSSEADLPGKLDRPQLFAALVMVGASKRELHELHFVQLPVLGVDVEVVLEPLREAEACVSRVEETLRALAKASFPDFQIPWENE